MKSMAFLLTVSTYDGLSIFSSKSSPAISGRAPGGAIETDTRSFSSLKTGKVTVHEFFPGN